MSLDAIKSGLARIVHQLVGRKLPYYGFFPCLVTRQDPDGTIELTADDPAFRGTGAGRIRVRYGLPGYSATVQPGARCLVAFEAGDPKRPYVVSWDQNASLVSLAFDGGSQPIARVTDSVAVGGLQVVVSGPGVSAVNYFAPVAGGGLNPIPIPIPVAPAPPVAITGTITTGNIKLLA